MSGRVFFDTNVLVYAAVAGDPRTATARTLLERGGVVGIQQLNEFAAIARRKLKRSWEEICNKLADICALCPEPVPITVEVHESGLRIAQRYGYGIYDSLSIAAALASKCKTFYSEDLHHNHVIEGMTLQNPFLRE